MTNQTNIDQPSEVSSRCCCKCKTPLSLSFGLANAGDFMLAYEAKLHDPNSIVRIRETCFKCSMKLISLD